MAKRPQYSWTVEDASHLYQAVSELQIQTAYMQELETFWQLKDPGGAGRSQLLLSSAMTRALRGIHAAILAIAPGGRGEQAVRMAEYSTEVAPGADFAAVWQAAQLATHLNLVGEELVTAIRGVPGHTISVAFVDSLIPAAEELNEVAGHLRAYSRPLNLRGEELANVSAVDSRQRERLGVIRTVLDDARLVAPRRTSRRGPRLFGRGIGCPHRKLFPWGAQPTPLPVFARWPMRKSCLCSRDDQVRLP